MPYVPQRNDGTIDDDDIHTLRVNLELMSNGRSNEVVLHSCIRTNIQYKSGIQTHLIVHLT